MDLLIEPAGPTMQDHYTCIDYMVDFGIQKVDYLEAMWELTKSSMKLTTSHEDMKATMEAIRGSVTSIKRSKI